MMVCKSTFVFGKVSFQGRTVQLLDLLFNMEFLLPVDVFFEAVTENHNSWCSTSERETKTQGELLQGFFFKSNFSKFGEDSINGKSFHEFPIGFHLIYLVSRCLGLVGVWNPKHLWGSAFRGSKYLLRRYLEDFGRLGKGSLFFLMTFVCSYIYG